MTASAPAHRGRDTARRVIPLFRPYRAQVAVVVGLIVQFILHRLIDKLVRKAEEGVLPDRISQAAFGRSPETPASRFVVTVSC